MARTDLGKVCVTPKGAWSSGTAYEFLDIVSNGGSSYLALQDVPANTALTNTSYWLMLASKGDKGDTGTMTVGSTTTGAEGTNASVTNSGTSTAAVWNFTIPRGNTGNGIASITLLSTELNVDTYRITYTDGDHFDFEVTNASSGVWGSITGTLSDQTDLQAQLDSKAPVIEESASGDIVSIEDGAPLPVSALSVAIEPVQDLHGEDSPYPAGAKSQLIYKTIKNANIYDTGLVASDNLFDIYVAQVTNGVTYTVSVNGVATASADVGYFSSEPTIGSYTADNIRHLDYGSTFTATYTGYIGLRFNINTAKVQLEEGSTATAYHAYSNICPITGHSTANVTRTGKNILNITGTTFTDKGITFTVNPDGSVKVNGTATENIWIMLNNSTSLLQPNMAYTISGSDAASTGANYRLQINVNNATAGASFGGSEQSFTTPSSITKIECYIVVLSGQTANNAVFYPMIRLASDTDATFEPYKGSTTVSISLGSTVYGGTLDVLTGELTVDRAYVKLTNTDTITGLLHTTTNGWAFTITDSLSDLKYASLDYISSINKAQIYNDASAVTGFCATLGTVQTRPVFLLMDADSGLNASSTEQQVTDAFHTYVASTDCEAVYPLATPLSYQLSPSTLNTLLGSNRIWADTGDTSVMYRADTKLFVEQAVDSAVTAVKRIMTTTTDTMVAPKNLTTGEIVIVGDDLYKATANIASGATLTVGSNVQKVTLAEWVASLVA